MKFAPETTSPRATLQFLSRVRCAGAYCFMFLSVLLSKHGAKHSPPGRRGTPDCLSASVSHFISHAKFRHVFCDYHIFKGPRLSKCPLGKLERCVRSPWMSLVSSRSQNRLWENEERGFQNDTCRFLRGLGINTGAFQVSLRTNRNH